MSNNDKRLSLTELQRRGIKLRRKLTNNELDQLINTLYGIKAGYTNITDMFEHTDRYPMLKDIVDKMYDNYGPKRNPSVKQSQTTLYNIRHNANKWDAVKKAVEAEIAERNLNFYKPIDYGNADAKAYNEGEYEQYTKDNEMEVVGERVSSGSGSSTSGANEQSGGEMPHVEITLGKTTEEILRRIKEPSVEEQMNKMYTELAKNKRFMSLSESQMKNLLKDEYQLDDEGVDIMFNSIVAKRAELLNKNQLKREQLTDVDVEKLQEQSQRDFERKMHDQNLRYILPAMLEKRDRLVVNRLNPELLKCGY